MATGDDYMIKRILKYYSPKHAVEIGVARPCHSLLRSIIDSCKIQLFEPNPTFYSELICKWGKSENVVIHNVAITNKNGYTIIILDGPTTMVKGENGPLALDPNRQSYVHKCREYEVACSTFDKFDDGTIDFLVIDAEGSEKYVFDGLISRPEYICVELNEHCDIIKDTKNVSIIRQWMKDNGYIEVVSYVGDTIFKKNKLETT